jgi:orotidine-5'-phosphate decarboxylase
VSVGDRVAAAVAERGSQITLGLDPDPARLLDAAVAAASERDRGSPPERAAAAVAHHCRLLLDASAPACVAVKLQLACFERLGAPGWNALTQTVAEAREHGLIVIADGKRGDVPHTAQAYAQALLATTPTPWGDAGGLGADAVTANPLLGRDSLEPIIAAARESGAGVFVLVRTSNAGAAEVQDQPPGDDALHRRLARLVAELGEPAVGASGLSDVGAVVGATEPGLIPGLRELMPNAIFLLPGVGAQGGDVGSLRAAFVPGRAGALVAVSRGIVDPAIEAGRPDAALEAAERLRQAAWELADAA